MIVLLGEIEIEILTEQTQTGGPVLLLTALMTTRLQAVMTALETGIKILKIQTGIGKARAGIWIDVGAEITMMTEAAETLIETTSPESKACRYGCCEREGEEQLQKEQEKLQCQLDEPELERQPRERHPSWWSEERERPRTGSEASQPGTSASSGRSNASPSTKGECTGEAKFCSSCSVSELRHRAAIPYKWKGKVAPAQPSEEGPARKDENKTDGMSVHGGHTGSSSRGPGDGGTKTAGRSQTGKMAKEDPDSRSALEPEKPEENPASEFSSASEDAALSVGGEDEAAGEDYTE
ncbi:Eukaryotic translation initiation factor 4B [Fukomys damarensis]|uniref:Eukaryotic translation initiation factor 4B n=1 Tax=Fukomys damarensis TaxID=885580 RepID=A0A091E271_FUKDA|nr:Eukaryotic translation initiation factor 4B [Fukomys damarensis]